jgi:hypothetical protein
MLDAGNNSDAGTRVEGLAWQCKMLTTCFELNPVLIHDNTRCSQLMIFVIELEQK